MLHILTLTVNPSIDVTTFVARLVPDEKLRCEVPRLDAGGGGVNVSRMIRALGGDSTALVAVAGPTGALMRELVVQSGLEAVFIEAHGLTRQSIAVHDRSTGAQFRFVLPGPAQDAAFAAQALGVLERLLRERDYTYVVASGSLPPGVPADFYHDVAGVVGGSAARLILDTSGAALEAALGRGVYLVKSNHIEAMELAAALGIARDDAAGLAQAILESGGAEAVILTHGADGALLAHDGRVVALRPPHVEVVSMVGAGDSFVGALCFALADGWPLERACAYGVAAAAAAVTTAATDLAHKPDVDRLFGAMGF